MAAQAKLGFHAAAALVLLLLLSAAAPAAEIRVVSTMNIRPALDQLRAPFEQATGNTLQIEFQGAKATRQRIEAGNAGDVVINARAVLDALQQQGKIVPGSVTDFAHSSVGVIVRAGAPRPDIATDEALKRALLAAASIAYPNPAGGSLGGNYFAGLIARWGIADALRAKTRLTPGGPAAGRVVAAGEAELGINQIAELMPVPGIEFLSPLPPALTGKVVMAAGILAGAKAPEAAKAWIAYLASPAAAPALKADGMAP